MPVYGTLDSLLEYIAPSPSNYFVPPSADDDRGSGSFEELLRDKLRTLTDILDDIEWDIGARTALSQNVQYLISQHYCYLKTKLFELYTWQLGGNRNIENRRSRLEQQLDMLNQEKRQELVNAWQAIAALKNEFRTWFKQYCDMVQRVQLVLPDRTSSTKGTHAAQIFVRRSKGQWLQELRRVRES